MVRAFDDQRFTPFAGVTGGGAAFAEALMHAVINHMLLFCLNQ